MNYCALCRLLMSQCIRAGVRYEDHALRFIRASSYLKMDGQEQPVASLYTGPESRKTYLQSLQLGCPKLVDPGSAIHIDLMTEWINSCNKHGCYPRDIKFFPTRVIDVAYSSKSVRLLSKTGILQGIGKYVALSHRWGPPSEQRAFCTLKKDIEGRDERIIEISALPNTFQDAIHVTRGLGVLHLWIDSLCIIQDDKDDWNRESQLMEQVFSSAYCTIAATCALGFDDGFLKHRPERQYVTMRGTDSDNSLYYVCEPIDDFHGHVDQSELNRRGWVLQERALSRRTIHFTETQAYWECGKGVRCETLTKMKNQKASFLGDSNFPYSAEDYVKGKKIKLIQSLYERYSNMALTVPSDRPFAIKGLESRLVHTFGGTGRYGVLQIYLHRCLLWMRSRAPLKPITSFPGEIIPSWSWMAYEGGIQYIDAPGSDVHWMNDITWLPATADLEEMNTPSLNSQSDLDTDMSRELKAPVWSLIDPQDEDITLDDERLLNPQASKCVVIGVSKRPADEGSKLYYVLIVTPVYIEDDIVWKRLGVGIMKRRYIALEGSRLMARIQ
ncbi:heterokaryon incompatibility protein-domain-containing protein [Xylaria castorea]|nr:heterokaryon incompatibility protein-domain-containing protein [Xylaria castorea]